MLLIPELTSANFHREVVENTGIVLVEFWAPNCPPCKVAEEFLDRLSRQKLGQGVKIVKVNTSIHRHLVTGYNIVSVPTFQVWSCGKLVAQRAGISGGFPALTDLVKLAKPNG